MPTAADTAPVERLPVELLQHIFLRVVHPPSNIRGAVLASIDLSPVVLRHVCHRWFQVATNYPLLWNQVHVSITGSPVQQAPTIPEEESGRGFFNDLFLRNSGSQPLDVVLLPCASLPPTIGEEDQYCVDKVMAHAHRIRSLVLDTFYASALRKNAQPFPALRTLECIGTALLPLRLANEYLSPFMSCPLLHEIRLDCGPQKLASVLPWKQLKKGTFRTAGADDLDCLLDQCAPLEQLTLEWFRLARKTPGPPKLFSHLTSLKLIQCDFVQVEHFCDQVILSSLTNLSITAAESESSSNDEHFEWIWSQLPLKHLIERSSCVIRSFTLHDYMFTARSFIETLRLLHRLEELHLVLPSSVGAEHPNTTPFNALFFRLLSDPNEALVPMLRCCSFAGSFNCGDGHSVAAFARARKFDDIYRRLDSSVPLMGVFHLTFQAKMA